MKVLKYGEGYPKIVVCDKCGSELEYEPYDVWCNYGIDMFGSIKEDQLITCPVCRHNIELGTITLSKSTPVQPKKRWWQR